MATLVGALTCGLTLWGAEPAEAARVPPDAYEITVPQLVQHGDIGNCGPTAAAMLLGAYHGVETLRGLRSFRDAIGEWTWSGFSLRRLTLPGQPAGMTTAGIMQQSLDNFGLYTRFERLNHPFLPPQIGAMAMLESHLSEGRPVITLMQSSRLWKSDTAGLHWVVVTGYDAAGIVFMDPADGAREHIDRAHFWHAWQLDPGYRQLPLVDGFTGLVADLAVPRRWEAAW